MPVREALRIRAAAESARVRSWAERASVAGTAAISVLLLGAGRPETCLAASAAAWILAGFPLLLAGTLEHPTPRGMASLLAALGSAAALAPPAFEVLAGIPVSPARLGTCPLALALSCLGMLAESGLRLFTARELLRRAGAVPALAMVAEDGREIETLQAAVRLGEVVRVASRGRVPVDGILISPFCRVDETPVLGESLPAEREAGDRILAGSIVETAAEVRAERAGDDVRALQALRASADAAGIPDGHPALPALASVFAMAAAAGTLLGAAAAGDAVDWERGIAVLLAASPLALAIPGALAPALAAALATRQGVHFTAGAAIEAGGRARRILLDTRLLLAGTYQVLRFKGAPGTDEGVVIGQAASAARSSRHPAARAIVKQAIGYGGNLEVCSKIEEIPARGTAATLPIGEVVVGSPEFVHERGCDLSALEPALSEALERDDPVSVVGRDGKAMGFFTFERVPRHDAALGVRSIRRLGAEAVLLSDETPERARHLAGTLGADRVQAAPAPGGSLVAQAAPEGGMRLARPGAAADDAWLLGADLRTIAWALAAGRAARTGASLGLVAAVLANAAGLALSARGSLSPLEAAALSFAGTAATLAAAAWPLFAIEEALS